MNRETRILLRNIAGTRGNFIMFITISLLVMVVAGINIVNLFSAKLEQDSRDIRMRIIVGSTRHQIIGSIRERINMGLFPFIISLLVFLIMVEATTYLKI